MYRKVSIAAAFAFALGTMPATAAFLPFNGYVMAAHTANGCAAVFVSPNFTYGNGGWFSIDVSATSTTTPQAVSAQVATIQSAAANTVLLSQLGVPVASIAQIGLDYDPTNTQVCSLDSEGDVQILTYRATRFNYPSYIAPHQ
jgi:hypothetical protein